MGYLSDYRNLQGGNFWQKSAALAGAVGSVLRRSNAPIGRALGSHDFGVSEMFGTAQVADSQLPEWQRLGYPSEEAYLADKNAVSNPPDQQPTLDTPTYDTAGGGTGAAEVYQPQPAYLSLNGQIQVYDLNNDADRERYFSDRTNLYEAQYNEYKTSEEDALRKALEEAGITYGQQYSGLQQDIGNLSAQHATTMKDLEEGYRGGMAGRQNYFLGLSPRAYQSAEGSANQYATQKYGEAQNTENTSYGQQNQALTQDVGNLERNYNNYLEQSRQSLAERLNQAREQTDAGIASLASDVAGIDVAKGTDAFKYGRSSVAPTQVDLSGYTPYINFNALKTSPQATTYQKYQNPTKSTATDPLSQFLGYTPDANTTNYLRQYLLGKA